MSLDGWGTFDDFVTLHSTDSELGSDVYLKLRCLDEAGDSQI